jgi:hypothetical protein
MWKMSVLTPAVAMKPEDKLDALVVRHVAATRRDRELESIILMEKNSRRLDYHCFPLLTSPQDGLYLKVLVSVNVHSLISCTTPLGQHGNKQLPCVGEPCEIWFSVPRYGPCQAQKARMPKFTSLDDGKSNKRPGAVFIVAPYSLAVAKYKDAIAGLSRDARYPNCKEACQGHDVPAGSGPISSLWISSGLWRSRPRSTGFASL